MSIVKDVNCEPKVEQGKPFDLEIEFETSKEGLSANLRAMPVDSFTVTPPEVPLPHAPDGSVKKVKVTIRRLKDKPSAVMLGVTLGNVTLHVSPEVV